MAQLVYAGQPYEVELAAALAGASVSEGKKTSLNAGSLTISQPASILRFLARTSAGLYGSNGLERSEVDHWIDYASSSLSPKVQQALVTDALAALNEHLQRRTWLLGNQPAMTMADAAVFGALHGNLAFHVILVKGLCKEFADFWRWMNACRAANAAFDKLATDVQAKAEKTVKTGGQTDKARAADSGKFVELEGAEMGKVVTRFPPEASGYLHIGHAKAAMLNEYFAHKYKGKMIMRFDDTNPAKESSEFEKVILEDLALLNIKPDTFTHTSDHFDKLLNYATELIKADKAFVDDSKSDELAEQRRSRQPSPNRNNSVERSLELWQEMIKGSDKGKQCVVRAKIDYASVNGAMRDPTLYRCKPEPHVRTGTKYKVYPTYDFACPIVDSLEGVTHALRTTEYHDRDVQYAWVCETLKLRLPKIWDFSRLNLVYTVMSKRQLTWFVEQGKVDGWSDPRFPTVRGILRHGMTVEGLRNFILSMGSSKSQVQMEWDKIWQLNKKVIDPVAPRHVALEAQNAVRATLIGLDKAEAMQINSHPKNPAVGSKTVWRAPVILLEQADAEGLKVGEKITLIDWGNAIVESIQRDEKGAKMVTGITLRPLPEDTDFKGTVKLTWIADTPEEEQIEVKAVEYTYIITQPYVPKGEDFAEHVNPKSRYELDMVGASSLADLKPGEIIQLHRKGFFVCDSAANKLLKRPLVLIYIPDGHEKHLLADRAPEGRAVSAEEYAAAEQELTSKKSILLQLKKSKADKADVRAAEAQVKELTEALSQLRVEGASQPKAVAATAASTSAPAAAPAAAPTAAAGAAASSSAQELLDKIGAQAEVVRKLKAEKADKDSITAQVQVLLKLKEEFAAVTGEQPPAPGKGKSKETKDGKAAEAKPKAEAKKAKEAKAKAETKEAEPAASAGDNAAAAALFEQVTEQGGQVRKLKDAKADKAEIDAAVKKLLDLKAEYEKLTGAKPPTAGGKRESTKPKKQEKHEKKEKKEKQEKKPAAAEGGKTRLGLEVTKAENFPEWYSQVITKAEMIEYYDVSGCYVLRPWSYALWEAIKDFFDAEIKKRGVKNAYFPIFVSQAALEREKEHIADFAPEVAWVTRSGNSELEEPIAIRPTSETVMYPSFANWVQSYRDLPIKINQWNNVVRWEFKQPTPFLRTREFLWQEGHTAFAERAPAAAEVMDILDLYRQVYEDLLAVPTVPGRKTEKEKFAGGDYTTTVEAYIAQNGRAIQGATSHHLGQNFSKMFNITFQNPNDDKETLYAYQNSWGITTRTIGVMVMVHGDDKGLVLPPRVASVQVIIVPTGLNKKTPDETKAALFKTCENLAEELNAAGVRTEADVRDNYSPPWKYNHYELKGVPIRLELGPRDLESQAATLVRRVDGAKSECKIAELTAKLPAMLEDVHKTMFEKAKKERDEHLKSTCDWAEVQGLLNQKNLLLLPFCGAKDCEGNIKTDTTGENPADPDAPAMGAKSLCIPFNQPELPKGTKCIHPQCSSEAAAWTMFGRSY